MTPPRRLAVVALAVAVSAAALFPVIARSADSAKGTPSAAASQPAVARSNEAIEAEITKVSAQLDKTFPNVAEIADPKARSEKAAATIPLMKKMISLIGELAANQASPDAKESLLGQQYDFYSYLVAFGDKDATTLLEQRSKASDPDKSFQATSALDLGNWWRNSQDPAAQQKILDSLIPLARAHPDADGIAQTLSIMQQHGPANDKIASEIVTFIRTTLTSDTAKQFISTIDDQEAQKKLIGKPLEFSARTTTGTQLSPADLKGKVVLLDFWATWCVPCNAELPRVKRLYDEYHAKGLEVVGVDCDDSDKIVNAFDKSKGIPWTQLRETSQTGDSSWNPLATKWHVNQIPTMFLLDQNGVLRYTDAIDKTDEKIQKLLADRGAGPAANPAPDPK